MLRFLVLGFAALVLTLAASAPVAAQAWAADRSRAEGRGIRLGDFELHPGVGSEVGYDSNVFLADDADDSVVLRISPHIYLSTLGPERLQGAEPKLTFRTGAHAAFEYYFDPGEGDIGIGQDAKLAWNASPIFTLELFDNYLRSIDPFGEPAAPSSEGNQLNYERDQLGLGARLQFSTAGKLVKTGLGYRYDLDWFEDELYESNTNSAHNITADTSWEFLPKTALFWNGTLQFHKYDEEKSQDAVAERNDSTRVQSKLGINGALTPRVGFTVAGGYGAGFFQDNNDYESIIAQLQLRWRLREAIIWSLAYDREYTTAFQGNFARMDRIGTDFRALIMGALLMGAKVELTFVDYGPDATLATGADGVTAPAERNDIHLLTNLNGEYRFTDWLALTAELGYVQNFTDYEFVTESPDPGGVDTVDEAEYKRFEAWLGVRAFL